MDRHSPWGTARTLSFLSTLQVYVLRNELGIICKERSCFVCKPLTTRFDLWNNINLLLEHIGEFRMVAFLWRDLGKACAAMWVHGRK